MIKILYFLLGTLLILNLTGCAQSAAATTPATPIIPTSAAFPSTAKLAVQASPAPQTTFTNNCLAPSNWFPYQIQAGETADLLALRFNITADELRNINCLPASQTLLPGSVLYVPSLATGNSAYTILPLGISAFSVQPSVAKPSEFVRLYWQGQGPVLTARIGWVFGNQFIEEQNNLPGTGVWDFRVPDDGRESITFMVRVSDGQQEIAAQTIIKVQCKEGWFFAPVPPECPTAPVLTTFHEQHFERGSIVYIPALRLHYVLIAGQIPLKVNDSFIPGMPLRDHQFTAPQGFALPSGPIYYTWREDGIRQALGYAIDEEVSYTGMLQRTVTLLGETIYLMASSGHVYQIGDTWGVIIPG